MANLLPYDNLISATLPTMLAAIEPGNIMAPESNSTFAAYTDFTRLVIDLITLIFFVAIIAVMVYFALKYRRTDDRAHAEHTSHHNTALELTWSLPPLIIVLVLFYMGYIGLRDMNAAPEGAYEIQVTAKKWSWNFTHPNGYQSNVLDVPAGRPVKLIMRSDDVLHSLYVPAFRVKQDVVPGRYATLWFEAEDPTLESDVPTPDAGAKLDELARVGVTNDVRARLTAQYSDEIRDQVKVEIEKKVRAERTEPLTKKVTKQLSETLPAQIAAEAEADGKKLSEAEIEAEFKKRLPDALAEGLKSKLEVAIAYHVGEAIKARAAEIKEKVDAKLKADVDAEFAKLDVEAKQALARAVLDGREVAKGHILFCAEYCGNSHSDMLAKVVVHKSDWKAPPFGEGLSQVELGKLLFGVKGCRGCHADEEGMASQCPPMFAGIFGQQRQTNTGTVTVDENYLRDSVLNPGKQIVNGYQNNMPVIKMSEDHINAIIAYLKTLGAPAEEAEPADAPTTEATE